MRVPRHVYEEILDISEARDCTLTEGFEIYVRRIRQEAINGARRSRPQRAKKPSKSASQRDETGAEEGAGKRTVKVVPKPGTL